MKTVPQTGDLPPSQSPNIEKHVITDESVVPATHFSAPILAHNEVAPRHFRLRLQSEHVARTASAGQFVHILPRPESLKDPLLRRAFSILSVQDDSFDILYRVMGRGTQIMSQWQTGQQVDVIGPLGQPFAPLAEHSILVGGGVGIPPLVMLARRNERHQGQVTALIGARTASDVLCRDDFVQLGVRVAVATEDGSDGHHGLVTALLQEELEMLERSQAKTRLKAQVKAQVYSCGPLAMLRAVAALCSQMNVPCQVSLEENMPCGVGICNGCVVPVTGAGDEYGRYRRVCVEGPVAWASEIDWSHWEAKPCP